MEVLAPVAGYLYILMRLYSWKYLDIYKQYLDI